MSQCVEIVGARSRFSDVTDGLLRFLLPRGDGVGVRDRGEQQGELFGEESNDDGALDWEDESAGDGVNVPGLDGSLIWED